MLISFSVQVYSESEKDIHWHLDAGVFVFDGRIYDLYNLRSSCNLKAVFGEALGAKEPEVERRACPGFGD